MITAPNRPMKAMLQSNQIGMPNSKERSPYRQASVAGRIIDQPINKNTENVPMEAIFRIASSALGGIILSSRSIKISLRLAITGPIPKNTITIKPTLTISYAPRIGMLNMNRKQTSPTTTSIIKTRPMEDITWKKRVKKIAIFKNNLGPYK